MNTYEDATEVSAQDDIDFREGFAEEDNGLFVPEVDDFDDAEAEWDDFAGFPTFEDRDNYMADQNADQWERDFWGKDGGF